MRFLWLYRIVIVISLVIGNVITNAITKIALLIHKTQLGICLNNQPTFSKN